MNHPQRNRFEIRRSQTRSQQQNPTLFPLNKKQPRANPRFKRDEKFLKPVESPSPESVPSNDEIAQQEPLPVSGQSDQDNVSNETEELPNEASNRDQESKVATETATSVQLKLVESSSLEQPTVVSADEIIDTDKNTRDRERTSRSSSKLFSSLVLYVIRLLILGLGIGAIVGTVLANIDLTKPLFGNANQTEQKTEPSEPQEQQPGEKESPASPLSLGKELTPLKAKLQKLATKYPKLQPGAFFVDIDNGAYVDLKGETAFSAASTIKIPVLIAFFEDIDAGKIYLDEMLTMKPELIASGSGSMQYQKPGKQFTALETATKMIVISDNTATNMLIDRMGGAEALNKRFRDWGLKTTVIRNPLPDLKGTNTTSPRDLGNLLAMVNRGKLVSVRSRDRLLYIMRRTRTRTLLPKGLENSATIAHKTGDIGSALGDAGIVDMPNGKRYIGAVMVKRPHNDYSARTLIQQISRTAYQHFKWYMPRPFTKNKDVAQ
ncbi:MAG: serine hydrolase [Xenococcaceae cyanobacterium]